jgi:hypothetical protein
MNALPLITALNPHCPEQRTETLMTAVLKVAMSGAVIAGLRRQAVPLAACPHAESVPFGSRRRSVRRCSLGLAA